MRRAIREWWDGDWSAAAAAGLFGNPFRHWTSDLAHRLWDFCRAEWKWIIGFLVAITGLVFGL